MKKLCATILAFLAIVQFSYAQWTGGPTGPIYYNNGNVGIGTISPAAKLNVFSTAEQLRLSHDSTNYATYRVGSTGILTVTTKGQTIFSGPGSPASAYTLFNAGTNTIAAMFGSGSTSGFTANQYGGAIRFNGEAVSWGDLSYYPNGAGNGNQGNFRLSVTGATLNTTPSGKLGTGELYVVGNVGIGTTSPIGKLSILSQAEQFRLSYDSINYATYRVGATGSLTITSTSQTIFSGPGSSSGAHALFNTGTNTIAAMFGSGSTSGFTADQYGGAIRFNGTSTSWGDMSYYPNGAGNGNQGNFRLSITGSTLNTTPSGKLGAGELYVVGNVGIGTTSPDQKLTVNGTIHSKEIKVDTSIPVPDYVFEPSYKLAQLSELKTYLDAHHHLPEMPSGDEMSNNGINLSEMNLKLLKKVEELTLYAIDQQKQIELLKQTQEKTEEQDAKRLTTQQQENIKQNQRISALEEALSKLTSGK